MLRIVIIQLFTVLITVQSDNFLGSYINTLTEVRIKSNGDPDFRVGEKVRQWAMNKFSKVNPEELGSYYQGDILHRPVTGANGIVDTRFRWVGAIPYEIAPEFTSEEIQVIQRAIDTYHQYTCLKFEPYKAGDIDYISIGKDGTGCWSSVGRVGGKQSLNLDPGCLIQVGTSIHELMHALGFFHEQSRLDRDDHVEILWQNIEEAKKSNFNIESGTTAFEVGYDYRSVMHYSAYAFTKDGNKTIETKPDPDVAIGQRDGFSASDIQKIKLMYNCP